MNHLRCLHCGKIYPREEVWILPLLGQRCTACAIFILAFWQVHAQPWLEMITKQHFQPTNRKEAPGP